MNAIAEREHGLWVCRTRLEKFDIADLPDDPFEREHLFRRGLKPFEVIESEGNMLVTAGTNALLNALTGLSAVTAFSNANANIGVGDGNGSVPTPSASDTDLTAPTNKLRKGMRATFPTTVAGGSTQFSSDYTSSEANFAWREWGVFNASSAGTMLNHKGESLGTKASGSTWTFTVTISIT